MLETHLNSPITRRRLLTGPVAGHIDAFVDWLHRRGYKPSSIDNLLTSLAGWTDWMLAAGFTAQDSVTALDACKLMIEKGPRIRHSRGPNHQSVTAASVFIRFLQYEGELPLPAPPLSACDYSQYWENSVRGCTNTMVTETTLDVYQQILVGLLDIIGNNTHAYSAEALRTFVLDRAHPHGIYRAKSIVVAVRSFIRFLGATGRCSPGMEHAIPGFASWQLSSVPRYLVTEDVERVIGSCADYVFGVREIRQCSYFWLGSGCALARSLSSNSPTSIGATGRSRSVGKTSPGVAATPAGSRPGDSTLSKSGQALLEGARGVHFSIGSAPSANPCGRHAHRA